MQHKRIAPVLGILSSIALWIAIAASIGEFRRFLPWPWEVAGHLWRMLASVECWTDIALTAARTIVAFGMGIILGVPLGMLLGLTPRCYDVAQVPVDFIRSVPVTALFPVAMLFLGVGDAAKLACVTTGCALILLVYSAGAVRNLPDIYNLVAQTLRLNRWQAFWKITVPASLPEIANGLRVAASISLILVVVLEMFIGSTRGLGLRLYDDQQLFRIHDMYATLFLIGALGYFANVGLAILQERLLHWAGK